MSWFVLAILSVFFYSVSTIVQRLLMKDDDSDPVSYMVVFQFLCTALILVYVILAKVSFPNLIPFIPFFIFNGVLIGLGSLMMFKSLKITEASEFTILSTTSVFWGVITSSIFLKEIITVNKIIGTVLIILGVVFISWAKRKKGKLSFHKGHLFALISAASFGAVFVSESYLTSQVGVIQDLLVGFFLPGLFVLLVMPRSVIKMKRLLNGKNLLRMGVFSLLYLLGAITIFMAYLNGGDASQIYPISNFSVVVTVVLAAIFLKERDKPFAKIVGSITAFIGILFLR